MWALQAHVSAGGCGQVFLCKARDTGERVALKRIRVDQDKEGMPITALREMKLLFRLRHKNVIRLKEVVRSSGVLLPEPSPARVRAAGLT